MKAPPAAPGAAFAGTAFAAPGTAFAAPGTAFEAPGTALRLPSGVDAPEAPCACPALLLSLPEEELERRGKAYAFGRRLGQGTFGTCSLGFRQSDGKQVAIKALQEASGHRRHAFAEAHVLDRCREHPHIPTLLDVFLHRRQFHLVMEYAGDALDQFIGATADEATADEARSLWPSVVRCITMQVASALGFIHATGLLHGDVKPQNIFVSTTPEGKVIAMLGDLGSVLEADPRARGCEVLVVQTLWWRAPEVLFGSGGFDQAIDIWSLGLVLAELGGSRFQDGFQDHGPCEVGYAFALFRQLGTPTTPELTGLPSWMPQCPKFRRTPWPGTVVVRLGASGLDLLDAMLEWAPTSRASATAVLEHAFLSPERFVLVPAPGGAVGEPSFQGKRHAWNITKGTLAVEVLEWLRADAALRPGTPEFRALAIDFHAARKDAKSEFGRKFVLGANMDEQNQSGSMCNLSLARMLPLPRLVAWRAAFLAINAEAFAATEASARESLRRLAPADRGRNGDEFLKLTLSQWFASCAELVFTEPGCVEDGFWEEPEHQDGGASVLHLGLTLYGRRTLACRRGLGLRDVLILNTPGVVYVGQLTGPVHQVSHQAALESELLEVPGLGRLAVSVMLRTSLFAWSRARLRQTSPSPAACFEALARCFREGFAANAIRLPTLAECQDHHR